MHPLVQAQLVNGETGDPALYIKFSFRRRAMLFDLGDLTPLSARQLLQVSHVFVSHTHIDHFAGFDRLLRVTLRRPMRIVIFGPEGFATRVAHKLGSYSWNLIAGEEGLEIEAVELAATGPAAAIRFRAKEGFHGQPFAISSAQPGIAFNDDEIAVHYRILDHGIPSLAFALQECERINVWKDRLAEMRLAVGPWLTELKRAVRSALPENTEIAVRWIDADGLRPCALPLSALKQALIHITPGQKIAYVVDTRISEANGEKIVDLARNADQLFIESVFLAEDTPLALSRNHLTAAEAGRLARRAAAKRIVPFHFSPRYAGAESRLRDEVRLHFLGSTSALAESTRPG